MSIKRREVDEEGFKAIVYTVSCDDSGSKMLEILCRDENESKAPTTYIIAKWTHGESGSGSGPHELQGLLSYGPIDSKRYKTNIVDILPEDAEGDTLNLTVFVEPKQPPSHQADESMDNEEEEE